MFTRVSKITSSIEEQLAGLLLLFSVAIITLQIILRSFFGLGMSGIYEVATFCVVWSVFLTAGLGVKRNLHVRVDILMRVVPAKVAFIMEMLVCVVLAITGAALLVSGWYLVQESLIFGDATLGSIRIPMWIPQLIVPISGVLVLIHTALRVVGVWRGVVPVIDDSETHPSA